MKRKTSSRVLAKGNKKIHPVILVTPKRRMSRWKSLKRLLKENQRAHLKSTKNSRGSERGLQESNLEDLSRRQKK